MNTRRQRILNFVLITIILGFVALSILVMLYPMSGVDKFFSAELQEHQNKFLDTTMYLISCPGFLPESAIMIVATSLFLFLFKYKKAALYVLFTMVAGLISTLVKALINRPRPADDLVRVVLKTTQQSFPSGHVLFYVIFFGFLIVLMYQLEDVPTIIRRVIISISSFLILMIPFSRIYLGAHWFTDVLGGFLLGLISLYVLSWLYLRKRADKEEAPKPEVK